MVCIAHRIEWPTYTFWCQVNLLRLKSNVASKWASKHLCMGVSFILLLMVRIDHRIEWPTRFGENTVALRHYNIEIYHVRQSNHYCTCIVTFCKLK